MKYEEAHPLRDFQHLAKLSIFHFKALFQEPEHANVGDMLKLISNFPRMIGEDGNHELIYQV